MKLAIRSCDTTPLRPCYQCGYVQRDHEFEGIHDPLTSVIFVLTIGDKKLVWVDADIIQSNTGLESIIMEKCHKNGVEIDQENFIMAGTHSHSGPCVDPDPQGLMAAFEPASPEYMEYLTDLISKGICEAWNDEGTEVIPKYATLIVDGIYSNRNDANKAADKTVQLLGFFKDDEPIGMMVNLACHNTVLGPDNYQITGELFGYLRRKLGAAFGCTIFMAQGNAGDMGNRQYRHKQDFDELERTAANLAEQIIRKRSPWQELSIDRMIFKDVDYKAHVTLDSSIYADKIARYEEMLKTETDMTNRKVMLSGIEGFKAKEALGDGDRVWDMNARIFDLGDVEIVCIPGELASPLGMMIKAASKARCCIVWGYNGAADLGYIIDREAFELECQEVNTTRFPEGIGEEYAEYIISQLP